MRLYTLNSFHISPKPASFKTNRADRLFLGRFAMSRKRAHDGFLADDLHIRLADPEAEPLAADRIILSNFSTCVRGLPADATGWDLSQLVVEGQAVQRTTVVTCTRVVTG